MNSDPDPETNVVSLKTAKPSREGWSPREQDALMIARLGAMSILEYERVRIRAAKELKCRVSWLDKTIERVRASAQTLDGYPPAKDGRTHAGCPISFIDNGGSQIMGFLVRSAHQGGQDRHLIVLADGNATVINSVPLSEKRLAQLEALRGTPE
jgi:hypothetical protein